MKPFSLLLVSLSTGFFLACDNQSPKTQQAEFDLPYEKFTLDNGLEVILHEDHSDPIVAVATLMHVGSNREKPGKTGFAHFFEHMSFNDSENTPVGANRKLIPEWGGNRNGGTWSDGTVYYEVVPKDAFEKIMWIDSDRLGFMINTVTKSALEREKQVVKNEKRQRVDNSPYGYTDEIIRSNLYPADHPYHWTVIGSLPDLQAATLEDVKEFYEEFYGANNATLVIAGDIDVPKTKELVQNWFGEIRKGPEVKPMPAMPVTLATSKTLYFEDNFAKLPEIRMVFPTVENYNKDVYALQVLGELLSGSKTAPLYQVLVEEEKLAPNVSAYQSSNELAGEFIFRVRANAGTDLDSVHKAIQKGFARFEENGISDKALARIKAKIETDLYRGIETVLNKAFTLATDNEFNGNPVYVKEEAKLASAVTKEDVMRVYNTYIKGKNHITTNFVPKGQLALAMAEAQPATVWIEEVKSNVAEEEVSQGEEADYEKTVTTFDRSEPDFGTLPKFNTPEIWKEETAEGMGVYGIPSSEVPLVEFTITLDGGHFAEPLEKSGMAYLTSQILMQGTQKKTPAELEEAIELLGANMRVYTADEELTFSASCLSKNFDATFALMQEIILEPRWDEAEFTRLKTALETGLNDRNANPSSVASRAFRKQLYGDNHPLGVSVAGTLSTIKDIELTDLKDYYQQFSSAQANFHIVGTFDKTSTKSMVDGLSAQWQSTTNPEEKQYAIAAQDKGGKLFFIDVPGSKQSVIYVGKLGIPASHADFDKLTFANEVLGGGSSGQLTQILRIEKGYTYGAYSRIEPKAHRGAFIANGSVRANATLPSLNIIHDLIADYSANFTDKEVAITQNKVLKGASLDYESLYSKLSMLRNISKYNKPFNYVEQQQNELLAMSLEDFKAVINKYLKESDMFYVVVGDAASQLQEVKQFAGKSVVILNTDGDIVSGI